MSKFVGAKAVERIEWDFEGVPHVGAQDDDRVPKTVNGPHMKGTLPEPTPDTAARFAEAHEEIILTALRAKDSALARMNLAAGAADDGEDADPLRVAAEVLSTSAAYVMIADQAREALRIVDVPAELLDQLPPRYLGAFLNYVAGELTGEGGAA